ncbi:type II toxin-antitoxin system RelB/DinJ family antitoxin [Patescibacteria group bacterium]|nr:type II toxin-antitoxin system RelB/DinJ family antitoxin [Patescibacteria group bacterium]MBU1123502.1 type II toxin-antitoxin system RelB/DinJ family antitoxin [Patescibacteria group bacterium]MBU1911287.1 type II toxin-antitoxin system RelB/DinJ family antitoxin [Patescibacteria group bacterium]
MHKSKSTIQIRTDEKLKKQVQQILEELGLDLSSAINLYLQQIIISEGIPFQIRTRNGFTLQQEQKMLREIEEAKKNGKRFDSVDEMFDDIIGK